MIILDIRLGRYSILALREPDVRLGVQREGHGEVEVDLPYLRLIFSGFRKATTL